MNNNTITEMIKSGFIINFIVMIIYNLTSFHLWFYILNQFIIFLWKHLLKNSCIKLKDILIKGLS
jgi:hypothetical protein